ncbi:cathepsin A [Vigna unguiculata]|uniref:Carboxypeptidase n=1 Tax=Vigna unguiculata TaxID=3917 RepID=A0A4D6LCG6_VIGUN|nr:cathepsin A [Vigna unguiculata]
MALTLEILFVVFLLNNVAGAEYFAGDETREEDDKVTNLPGQPPVNFSHYAGYVKLRPEEEKALFYWFFEAQESPSDKPLVLWLSGGPGCSSVAFGAAQEIGPFHVDDPEHITFNKFSWNRVANVIFLESPISVGFSYTNNSDDLSKIGDQVVALDNYAFLVGWFKRFPRFKSHEFYIIGESYGGHYAPQLAEVIHEGNKNGTYINLKGFMMGNAVINDVTDLKGVFDFALCHAIISKQVYDGIRENCDFMAKNNTKECSWNVGKFLQAYSDINIFSIYSPVCLIDYERPVSSMLHVVPYAVSEINMIPTMGYDPCKVNDVEKYFNKKDVQKAIHAYFPNITKIKKWNDSPITVLPVIQKLLRAGLRIWMYSGDTDGRIPVLSTRYGLRELKLNVTKEWRAWFEGREVGGWVEEYEGGLTFASIRGAGHFVSIYKPQEALSLFSHFLSAQPLPSSRF